MNIVKYRQMFFIQLDPGPNVIKHLPSQFTNVHNKQSVCPWHGRLV
jgi:hypothetical protein